MNVYDIVKIIILILLLTSNIQSMKYILICVLTKQIIQYGGIKYKFVELYVLLIYSMTMMHFICEFKIAAFVFKLNVKALSLISFILRRVVGLNF